MIENPGASQKVTTITYNSANQVTKMTLPDTKVVQAWWDLAGHQTLVVYPDTSQRRWVGRRSEDREAASMAARLGGG